MSNDDNFKVTTSWRPVEANGSPITNGNYTIFARSNNRVEILKSNSQPSNEMIGAGFLNKKKEKLPYSLSNMENLYVKTGNGTAIIGVMEI